LEESFRDYEIIFVLVKDGATRKVRPQDTKDQSSSADEKQAWF